MLLGRYCEDIHECERQLMARARAGNYTCFPFSPSEEDRLAFLKSCNLTIEKDPNYERIVSLLAEACDVPICAVTLVEDHRQFFKAQVGLDTRQTGRDASFCAHAIGQPGKVFVVPDATMDMRFSNNPLVKGAPNIQFYAGAPLVVDGEWALGALCVIDRKPRKLTDFQFQLLSLLAKFVSTMIEKGRTRPSQRVKVHDVEVPYTNPSALDTPDYPAASLDLPALVDVIPRPIDRMALHTQKLTNLLAELSKTDRTSSPQLRSKLHSQFKHVRLLYHELFPEDMSQATFSIPIAASPPSTVVSPPPTKRRATSLLVSSRLTARPTECQQCHTTTTPEWRRGPLGPRTLCNACGLRYAKRQKKLRRNVQAKCSVGNLCS